MASRDNTPMEIVPKILRDLGDMKLAATATNQPQFLQLAVNLETALLKELQVPLQQMQGGGGAPMGNANVSASPGGMPTTLGSPQRAAQQGNPFGAPGGPGGAPNLDELRRLIPG